MKSQDPKTSRAKTGVSRLWLGVAAVAGAAIAYLGDRERGNARRQAALRQLSGVTQAAANRTNRWRKLVTGRLPGRARVTVPTEPKDAPTAPTAPSRSKRAERNAEAAAETKKPEL